MLQIYEDTVERWVCVILTFIVEWVMCWARKDAPKHTHFWSPVVVVVIGQWVEAVNQPVIAIHRYDCAERKLMNHTCYN